MPYVKETRSPLNYPPRPFLSTLRDKRHHFITMIRKSPEAIHNLKLVSLSVVLLSSIIFATFVFDKPSADSTAYVPQIEMAMQAIGEDQRGHGWMNGILPLYITTEMTNISKIDKNGKAKHGSMTDMFPTSGPSRIGGTLIFKIAIVDRKTMPDISNVTQMVVPMVFIRAANFPEILKSALKLSALFIKWFSLLYWISIFSAVGCIAAGMFILCQDRPSKID